MTENFNSAPSSPESYDDEAVIKSELWHSPGSGPAGDHGASSREPNESTSAQAPKISASMQKRRRVTRACDECRRKKIKCDGKQPCTHCTVYSYDCTFDQPSNRRRNPAPQYIEALENRLERAEALLRTALPEVNLDDELGKEGSKRHRFDGVGKRGSGTTTGKGGGASDPEADAKLESMVEATGQLDIDDQGKWDFHGHSSGYSFLRRMRAQFGDLLGPAGTAGPFIKSRPKVTIFDSPRSASDSPMDQAASLTSELPSKEVARELISNTLDDACVLMRFVHQPTFYRLFDRIYDLPAEQFGDEENRFLPLLYVVLAVGTMFAKTEQSELEKGGYESAIDQGFIYFKACRWMIDITDCRDLLSLQAVLFMVIFLQSSAKLSTCYSYVGIALRSALRMGMHRSVAMQFNPIDREVRKRLFWMIRKMDTYVGAQLGLPEMLNDDDIDQEDPMEVDDEYITLDGILPMPEGKLSMITATNAHSRLVVVLTKVIKYIYPIKGETRVDGKTSETYVVSQSRIREIERDLQEWMDKLPMQLRTGGEASPELARVQQLLRMSYAHTQMVLYRPFLHYVSQSYTAKTIDSRSYACAAACVSVSRNIVHITSEMKKRGMLNGAYWFIMYTNFFAVLSLVFFVLENPDNPGSHDILQDAKEGRQTLASLSKRSMAADRCTVTLGSLFDQLPEKLKKREQQSRKGSASSTTGVTSKKRPAGPSPPRMPAPQALHSAPDLHKPHTTPSATKGGNKATARRANTAPGPSLDPPRQPSSSTPSRRGAAPSTSKPPSSSSSSSANVFAATSLYSNPQSTTSSEALPHLSASITTNASLPLSADSLHFPTHPDPASQFPDSSDPALIPDLNAMMFPSADPFAYPVQPITTLENNQRSYPHPGKNDPTGTLPSDGLSGTQTEGMFLPPQGSNDLNPGPAYENLDAHFFAPLSPFYLQHPSHQQAQHAHHPSNPSTTNPQPEPSLGLDQQMSDLSPAPDALLYASHARPPATTTGMSAMGMGGINFEEMFGAGVGGGGWWAGEEAQGQGQAQGQGHGQR